MKALKALCAAAASALVAGCGVDRGVEDADGFAGVDDAAGAGRAAQALSAEGQVCIAIQRGAGSSSVADAVLWQRAPTWNDGTNVTISTGASESSGLQRSLLRFDLSGLPAGAEVVSASLSLSQVYKTVDSTVRVHRVTRAWEESTVTWASFGDAFDPAVAGSFTSGGGAGSRSSDITGLAQAWVSGEAENHGVLIEEEPARRTDYRSSEKPRVEDRPKLDLCYVVRDPGTQDGVCAGPGLFRPLAEPAGYNPVDVAAADVDGDGDIDLAVVNSGTSEFDGAGHVSVLLNQGNGTFADPVSYAVGSVALSIEAADLNGDGHPDLAVANSESADVSVLLNEGDGTFATAVSYPAGARPAFVAAADLNGDGHIDLTAANGWAGGVSLLLNQGDGTFAAPVEHASGGSTGAVAAADLNGDGRLDLAAVNSDNGDTDMRGNVSVLLNQGNNTFSAPVSYALHDMPLKVTAADLNGDGHTDLAVVDYIRRLSVLLNRGDGTFAAPVTYAVGLYASSVAAADLNGDGHPDLAVGSYTEVGVLLNQGDGTFAAPVNHGMVMSLRSVEAADLNGDGRLDLAVTNTAEPGTFWGGDVRVLLNQGSGTFASSASYAAGQGWVFGPESVVAADLSGDGHLDLAVANGDSSDVKVLHNRGDGTFGAPVSHAVGVYPLSVAAADLNGDGHPDLAVGSYTEVAVLLSQGDGTLAAAIHYAAGSSPVSVAAADLDGDGDPDLAVANSDGGDVSVLLNQGNGTFAAAVHYAAGSSPSSVAAADLDGDGLLDLAVTNAASDDVSVLLNQGNGTFAAAVHHAAGRWARSVAAADLDGDGDLDLAVANSWSNDVSVLLNQGDGTFAAAVHHDVGAYISAVAAADLDGDGSPDLALADGQGAGVLLNQGNGTFAAAVHYAADWNPISIAAADLNGDGNPDLAVANQLSGNVSVLLNACL
ncbi:FG-GAP-like repeat-containing protein [Sorangium sp. So ce131]|uniref:FG-GAP-like repeat-containing protein n=1 Tax=Sorangium sp. So ce131 TaxID=3133282 RepID=UPI003F5F21F1